jgi:hypothetical protein
MNKLPIATRAKILSMLCGGASMRFVSRLTDTSINTVFLMSKAIANARWKAILRWAQETTGPAGIARAPRAKPPSRTIEMIPQQHRGSHGKPPWIRLPESNRGRFGNPPMSNESCLQGLGIRGSGWKAGAAKS